MLLNSACSQGSRKGCTQKIVQEREVAVYYTAAELRAEPKILPGQALRHPGKIYWTGNYIFVTEKHDGIHIVDNTDPAHPKTIKYIQIPGNWDMATKGNMLYVDSYSDLLVFNIANPQDPKLMRRLNDVWNWDHIIGRFMEEKMDSVVLKEKKMVKYEYLVSCDDDVDLGVANKTVVPAAGQGGSMARFCVSDQFLYAVDNHDLYVFNVQVNDNPILAQTQHIDDKIEMIFSYGKRLFIGGLQGVYIYDKTDPTNPKKLEHFKHVESCDPVVVDDNYAYVTLREGSNCRQAKNSLLVLDVHDFNNATLLAEYPMQHPHGLAVKDKRLYICEGDFGLKVFDMSDKKAIDQHLLQEDKHVHAYDVIAHDTKPLLLLVGNDGLFMYSIGKELKNIGSLQSFGN